jgi:hypothetical protein
MSGTNQSKFVDEPTVEITQSRRNIQVMWKCCSLRKYFSGAKSRTSSDQTKRNGEHVDN